MENQENSQFDHQENNQNQWQQPPVSPLPQMPPQNNMALASMIVSILSLLACCIPPLQFIMGMVALLLAIFSKKGKPFSGFAIAGMVISILSLVISIGMVLYMMFAFSLMKDPQYAHIFNEILEMYETMPVK